MLNHQRFNDWREALDDASYWEHDCEVRLAGDGAWLVEYFDNPEAIEVSE